MVAGEAPTKRPLGTLPHEQGVLDAHTPDGRYLDAGRGKAKRQLAIRHVPQKTGSPAETELPEDHAREPSEGDSAERRGPPPARSETGANTRGLHHQTLPAGSVR
jgi:hypothetical protein